MPAKIVPCYFSPSVDNAWSVAPGALTGLQNFAPLQIGAYGSMGVATPSGFSGIADLDFLKGKMFRQVAGTVRLLMFRPGNIDEYDNAGTKTNRGTGYNAATANWEAAAWGNQIIACNYLDATQSSTGAGFAGLGGGSPKARYVAANQDFVILADVDDSGSNVFSDMVWWCGLRNPATWTPAIATQAGNIRLLGAPGPIRNVVAFRGGFVVFKDNSMFMGTYVGPPPNGFIFDWTMISNRIGLIAPDAVAELDGKLYFLHSSGFYEFDGQTIRNIGMPVYQQFGVETGYFVNPNQGPVIGAGDGIAKTQTVADDIDGIVWFQSNITIAGTHPFLFYGYNPRTQRWGRGQLAGGGVGSGFSKLIVANFADINAFLSGRTADRFWVVANGAAASSIQAVQYPVATAAGVQAYYITGLVGSREGSSTSLRHHWRTLNGTTADSAVAVTINGYSSETKLIANGTATGAVNTEFDYADVLISSRFKTATVQFSVGKVTILAGIGFDEQPGGRR